MAITLETVARNAACNAVVDLVDAGGGEGKLEICDGSTVLATFTLETTAFGAPSNGVATAASFPKTVSASASGTADNYKVRQNGSPGTLLWSGTVGTSDADLIVDNTSINNGQDVTIDSWTHTAPA